MLGLDGATATSPMLTVASLSNWCWKVMPVLVVFSSPPEAVATHHMLESDGLTARATMRPDMFAGPSGRQVKAWTHSAGRTLELGLVAPFFPPPVGSLPGG